MHMLTTDPLKMMCTTNLCPIIMLTCFANLLFENFDAVILSSRCNQEVNSSGHGTIYTKHVTLHTDTFYYYGIC